MTALHIVDLASVLAETLTDASPDLMRSLLQTMINALLSADADAVAGEEWGKPSPDRLLITAGENIDRFRSEAAFARLCGAAPVPVSSGKSHRMRLHRGGDRKANRALHMFAVVRLRYDPRTIDYMQRRLTEGLSKKDVLRCLKRFIAREVFHDLKTDLGTT